MAHRLDAATSPYLRQHRDNPIDWWEWTGEAFTEARRRNVPVLLSIGYAACHWCHVMARESFSDPTTAAQVNASFVAIKVDREERPDVDAVYMAATQAMTGRGGWPMTCFLTPAGEPFHCGTYYPSAACSGLPSFRQMLTAVTLAWTNDGDRVTDVAGRIAAGLERMANTERPPVPVDAAVLDEAAETLFTDFDATDGGFGAAPKFPPTLCLEFLLRYHERTGSLRALQIVELTCDRMARGGLYDQLSGGFARYAVDDAWAIPHFEKMLYDNALLLRLYAHVACRSGSALARRVAIETAGFLLTEMMTREGAFASALDADADGQEGLTYLWSPAELTHVLGIRDATWAARLLEVTTVGTFERGRSTLQLPYDPDDPGRWHAVRAKLLDARRTRPQPDRDDNVVTAWNAMAACVLAEAAVALGQGDWVDTAGAVVDFLLQEHFVAGRLRRSSHHRRPGPGAAVLEDHAWLARALLALHQATGVAARLEVALTVLDLTLDHFADPRKPGAFFDIADDADTLIHRLRDTIDNATPSGSSVLADALLTASALTGGTRSRRYREIAEAATTTIGDVAGRHARFAGQWLATAEAMVTGPLQVAVAGEPSDPRYDELLRRARVCAPGGTVVVAGPPDSPGVPLLAGRHLLDDGPAVYVCRGYVCERPVNVPDDLEKQLLRFHDQGNPG